MQLTNEAAEQVILQNIVQKKDYVLLASINADWLTGQRQNLLHILRLKKECIEYFYCQTFVQENSIDISLNLLDVIFKGDIIGEIESAKMILEEKHLLRQVNTLAYHIHTQMENRIHPLSIVSGIQEKITKIRYTGEKIEKIGENLAPDTMDLIDFGKPALESLYLAKQEIMVLGGERGHQKTNYALDLICEVLDHNVIKLKDESFKVMYFSREMSYKNLKARLLAKLFKIPYGLIRTGKYNVKEIEQIFQEKFWYYNDNFLLVKPEQINSVEDIAKFLLQEGPTVWAFDYMQLMARATLEKGEDVNNRIAWMVTQFKSLAQLTNTLGIIISTLTKHEKGRISHVPRLEDLYSSVEIQYLATWVGLCYWPWFYWRNLSKNVFFVLWEKNRNEEPFTMPLKVLPETSSFENLIQGKINLEDYLK